MTARDVLNKALIMLGYTRSNGEMSGEQELFKRGIVAVNQVCADLHYALGREDYKPIETSSDEIDLPERILYDVVPYGVAMFVAQSENDGDSQQLYASLYNKKRKSVRSQNSIQDVMPKGSDF